MIMKKEISELVLSMQHKRNQSELFRVIFFFDYEIVENGKSEIINTSEKDITTNESDFGKIIKGLDKPGISKAAIKVIKENFNFFLKNFVNNLSVSSDNNKINNAFNRYFNSEGFLNLSSNAQDDLKCCFEYIVNNDDAIKNKLKELTGHLVYFSICHDFHASLIDFLNDNKEGNLARKYENHAQDVDLYNRLNNSDLNSEFYKRISNLPDFLLKSLFVLLNVVSQNREMYIKGAKRQIRKCEMHLYTFISLCKYYEAQKSDLSDFYNLRKSDNSMELLINKSETLKFIFSELLTVSKISDSFITIKIIEKNLKKLEDYFNTNTPKKTLQIHEDKIISAENRKMKHQEFTLKALFGSYIGQDNELFHLNDTVEKIELNSTISEYFNAIVFDGYNTLANQEENLIIIRKLLETRNLNHNYLFTIIEISRGLDKHLKKPLLDLSFEERFKLICEIAKMDSKNDGILEPFWSGVVKYLVFRAEKCKSPVFKRLIENGCISMSIWTCYVNSEKKYVVYPFLRGKILGYILQSTNIECKVILKKLYYILTALNTDILYFLFNRKYGDNINQFQKEFKKWVELTSKEPKIKKADEKRLLEVCGITYKDNNLSSIYTKTPTDCKLSRKEKNEDFYIVEKFELEINKKHNTSINYKLILKYLNEDFKNVILNNNETRKLLISKLISPWAFSIFFNPIQENIISLLLKTQDNELADADLILLSTEKIKNPELYDAYKNFVFNFADNYLDYNVDGQLNILYIEALISKYEFFTSHYESANNLLLEMVQYLSSYLIFTNTATKIIPMIYRVINSIGFETILKWLQTPDSHEGKIICRMIEKTVRVKNANCFYRRHLERLFCYLISDNNFFLLPLKIQTDIFHYIKPKIYIKQNSNEVINTRAEFETEFKKLVHKISETQEIWNSLSDELKIGVALYFPDDSIPTYVSNESSDLLGIINNSRVDSRKLYEKYKYSENDMFYHLMHRYKDNPELSARFCAMYLTTFEDNFKNFKHRRLNLYSVALQNPCISEYAFYISSLMKRFYLECLNDSSRREFDSQNSYLCDAFFSIVDNGKYYDWYGNYYDRPSLEKLKEYYNTCLQVVELEKINIDYWEELAIQEFTSFHKRFIERKSELFAHKSQEKMPEDIILTLEEYDNQLFLLNGGMSYFAWKELTQPRKITEISKTNAVIFRINNAISIFDNRLYSENSKPTNAPTSASPKSIFGRYCRVILEKLRLICQNNNIVKVEIYNINSLAKLLYKKKILDKEFKLVLIAKNQVFADAYNNKLPSNKPCLFSSDFHHLDKIVFQLDCMINRKINKLIASSLYDEEVVMNHCVGEDFHGVSSP